MSPILFFLVKPLKNLASLKGLEAKAFRQGGFIHVGEGQFHFKPAFVVSLFISRNPAASNSARFASMFSIAGGAA